MKRFLAVMASTGLLAILRLMSGFVIAKLVAIHTGPSGMAMLGQLQGLVGALNGIATAPVGSGVVRYTAEHHASGFDACAPWWGASLRWSLCLLLAIVPLTCFFSMQLANVLFNQTSYFWLVCVVALALPLSVASGLLISVINGQQRYKRYVVLSMISVLLSTGIMVGLTINHQLVGALFAVAIFSALSGFVMLFASWFEPWFKLRYWWGNSHSEHFKGIGGYVAMSLTGAICLPLSMIVVRKILIFSVGWEQAGIWQAAYKISEVYLGVITIALGTFFLPRLSALQNETAMRKEIFMVAKVLVPIILSVFILFIFFRDLIILILFTKSFISVRDLIIPQAVGDSAKILSWLFMYPLISKGAVRWFVSAEMVFFVILIFVTYVFVNAYGLQGASIAYAINNVMYLIFSIFAYRHTQAKLTYC